MEIEEVRTMLNEVASDRSTVNSSSAIQKIARALMLMAEGIHDIQLRLPPRIDRL